MSSQPPALPLDATALAAAIAQGELNASDALEAAIRRCDAVNPQINAVIVDLREAARADVAAGPTGPFAGVPFLLKDLGMDLAGVPTSQGNAAVARLPVRQTDHVVRRWREAGLVTFGKTNVPELGLKAITEPAAFGPCRNPWNLDHAPGGSSGGAAAAVAAGIVPVAAAADGGGSIRIPAAYCGLFGLKPSRGRVSGGPQFDEQWEGAVATNVISRSVRDSAAMLDLLTGPEPGDPFVAAPPARPYADAANDPPAPLRIALHTASPIGGAVDAQWAHAAEACARHLESLGHVVVDAAPPVDGMALAHDYLTLYFGQVSAQIAWFGRQGVPASAFEPETRALGLIGDALSAGEYALARAGWNAHRRALGGFLQGVDLLLTPTCAQPPARIGALDTPPLQARLLQTVLGLGAARLLKRSGVVEQLAFENLHRTPFTQLANLCGVPAMSVPWGLDDRQLPLGVQFTAPWGGEDLLFRVAGQLEATRPWAALRPPVFAG